MNPSGPRRKTRNLPRRVTSAKVRPSSASRNASGGQGPRASARKTRTSAMRRPASAGPSSRTIVSTSGSSGIYFFCFSHWEINAAAVRGSARACSSMVLRSGQVPSVGISISASSSTGSS